MQRRVSKLQHVRGFESRLAEMTEEGQFSGRSTHVSRFQKLVDDETTRVQSSLMSQRREM